MNRSDFIGLFAAYGFGYQEESSDAYKMRFSGFGRFMDLWSGKKGYTLGIYNPRTKQMYYHRRVSIEKIEDYLIGQNKNV